MRGVCGGLALGPVSVKTPNCGGGEIDSVALEDSLAVKLEDSLAENFVEKVVKAKRATGAGPPTPPPGIMTADTGLEMQGSAGDLTLATLSVTLSVTLLVTRWNSMEVSRTRTLSRPWPPKRC